MHCKLTNVQDGLTADLGSAEALVPFKPIGTTWTAHTGLLTPYPNAAVAYRIAAIRCARDI